MQAVVFRLQSPFRKVEEKKDFKKGNVYVITDRGNVVTESELKKYEKATTAATSTDIKPWKVISTETLSLQEKGLVPHPYPLDQLFEIADSNITLSRTINQLALDVAGRGWTLVPTGKEENSEEKDKLEEFLDNPNEDETFRNIIQPLVIDWGWSGNYALELVRDTHVVNGKTVRIGIHHLPIQTIYRHKDKKRFCQLTREKESDTPKYKWFKKFMSEDTILSDSGEVGTGKRANEIIYYKTYYPKSVLYGVPNFIPALGEILSLVGIREYNLSFFQNYGVPVWLVIMSGEWNETSFDTINKFFNEGVLQPGKKGHKSLVVETGELGGDIKLHPLSTETREGSFRFYRDSLRDDILSAYSMPPYRIGISQVGKLGGTNIKEATEIYKNSVIEPLQTDIEDMINMLISRVLECKAYKFKLNDIDLKDARTESEIVTRLVSMGLLTLNQGSVRLGMDEFEGGNVRLISRSFTILPTPEVLNAALSEGKKTE